MPDSDEFDARLVRAFRPGPGVQVDESAWPASVPAMAQLLREGLELAAGLTVLVGENGSGPGHRVAAVHAGPAVLFPASAVTDAGHRIAA